MISINHATFVISIPKADTTLIGTNAITGYEIRSYDEYALMREVADYLCSEQGQALPNAFNHATQVTISGVNYARSLTFLNPYTVTFENGSYQVRLTGGTNNNLLDVINPNSVSVISSNSAGLQTVNISGGGGATPTEIWTHPSRTLTTSTTGMFSTPLSFKADDQVTAVDPGAGKLNWNNSTQQNATEIYIDSITENGLDLSNYISLIPAGSTLFVQDKDDANKYQKWLVSNIINNSGWITIAVDLLASSGSNIAKNQLVVIVFNNLTITQTAPTAQENANAVAQHPDTLTVKKFIGLAP